jgi:isoleucyl-tRNA synthetase
MDNKLSPFAQAEEKILKFWEQAEIFEKSLAKKAPRGDYVFYDGPPFATGTPHYGHLVASIMKDAVPRYFTMQGYRVERKWGWDCHGLPIENIVEKEMGTKSKKEIENLGVEKFNNLCRSKVFTYVDEWKRVVRRLGRWADMENAYKTMDLDYMETIWWALKLLWDKGLIYKDYRSMHICPRCETTLSQSEVTEGYRDIKDLSATAKFKLLDEPDTYVLAWTTTPWTLIGNVALAVGRQIEYVKVKVRDAEKTEIYILAKNRLSEVMKDKEYEMVQEKILGQDLVGRAYQPLFDYYAQDEKLVNRKNGWKIYDADFVTTEEGSGVVHIAPAFGEDDMKLGKQNNLPFIQHVGLDGLFKSEVSDFIGLHVKPIDDHISTDVEIIKYLAAHGTLFSKEKYEHSYPHCWRCDTPLINYATSSWFVAVTKIKADLLNYAKDINWSPDYIKSGRFGNWLEGARDWSISRQRFWASAIPIWECACGERRMIGSVAELEKLTGQKITDIHKDKVDPLTFACEKCGGSMKRIPDVLDCWFESGSMPYAQLHYPFENKEKFEKNFPAQFIAEGADQTRAWFYYLHVIAGGIKKTRAFNNVIVNGIVLAEDGKKMSKRLQNYPDPSLVMDKYGADALRACLLASPVMLAENLNFSEKFVEEALRKNIMLLENVYKFYEMYAGEAGAAAERPKSANVLDRWIIAKYDMLLAEVTEAMEKYNLPKAMRPITDFIDELSTWYLRRSRDRFKIEGADKQAALGTMKYILNELAKIVAPFMPFMAESLWQRVSGYNFQNPTCSVHLEKWPQSPRSFLDSVKHAFHISGHHHEVLDGMTLTRRIVELGLAKRDEAGIKIRQMLRSATVNINNKKMAVEYLSLIKDELNIQEIIWQENEAAEYPTLSLDTELTPELKQEGLKRELVRFINMLRKDASLNLSDTAAVYLQGADSELQAMLDNLIEDIKKETLSASLETVVELPPHDISKEVPVNGVKIVLALKKT